MTLDSRKQYVKIKQGELKTEGGEGTHCTLIYVAFVLLKLPLSVLTSLGKF